jgi:hypothetical protein
VSVSSAPPASQRSRRALQVVLGVLALIPLGTGLMDVVVSTAALPGAPSVTPELDSNYRFFGVVWAGMGVALIWAIPRVERATTLLRGVFAVVFLGGLARCLSLVMVGVPEPMFLGLIVLELTAPPIVIAWQSRIATDS